MSLVKTMGKNFIQHFPNFVQNYQLWTLSLKNSTHLYHHSLPLKYYRSKKILWTEGHAPPVLLVNVIILVIIRITIVLTLFLSFSYFSPTFIIFLLGFQNFLPFLKLCFSKTTDSLGGGDGKWICVVPKGLSYFLCSIPLPWPTYLVFTFWFIFSLNLGRSIRWWC